VTAIAWKASFKKDDSQWDGLAAHLDDLVKDPLPPRYALVRLEVVEVKDLVQEGIQQPKVAVRHVELVTDPTEVLRVGSMMQTIYAKRTGRDDSQPSLFDSPEERQRDADADEGEEIMAERAEAEALRNNEPWPGDVEFSGDASADYGDEADPGPPSGSVADEAESSAVKRSARKPRK
jgi:hypothetical protein